jgi:hypothetical protein
MPTRTRKGKIGQLSFAVREELNQRIRDGQLAPKILPWLNALPEVKALLAEKYGGKPISDGNLSEWRAGGFAEWAADQEQVSRLGRLSELALRLGKACAGGIHNAAAAIQGGQIMEALEKFDSSAVEELLKADPKNYVTLLKALTDQGKLQLDREKFHRETAELFLKFHEDQRAVEIAESKAAKTVKMDRLVQLMFGDRPDASAQS